jgi:type IV pilus assembly protein PilQ
VKRKTNQKTYSTYLILLALFITTLPASQTEVWKEPPKYTGEHGSFIFHDADLMDVIFFFSKVYKFNIVIAPDISGKVTIRLINVPWDQALDTILKQHGFTMIKDGNMVSLLK